MYFEDFQIGQQFVSPARTITETDVMLFAGLSGDYNPLHTDAEFAKKTIFKERIAYGLLGLAVVSGFHFRMGIFEGTAIAFLGVNWHFCAPIFLGDTVHCKITIIEKRESKKPDRGIIVREVELINQKGEIVQKGQMR